MVLRMHTHTHTHVMEQVFAIAVVLAVIVGMVGAAPIPDSTLEGALLESWNLRGYRLWARSALGGPGYSGEGVTSDSSSAIVVVSKQYDFFTVYDSGVAGAPCQGDQGMISLYLGANATLLWNTQVYGAVDPVSISLNLTINSPGTAPVFIIAANVAINASTSAYTFALPASSSAAGLNTSAGASYSLEGSFADAAHAVTQFPTNTTDVVILAANATCDRQTGAMSVNTPLAIGLGSATAVAVLLLSAATILHAKRLQRRDDKGKYWIDGPRSKDLAKKNLINTTLSKMRSNRKKNKKDKDDSSDSSNPSSSLDGRTSNDIASQTSSANPNILPDLLADNNNSTNNNPFLADFEMKQVPLKDESSSSSNNNTNHNNSSNDSKLKESGGALVQTVRRKTTQNSFAAFLRFNSNSNDDSQKDDSEDSNSSSQGHGFGNYSNNIVRQMIDPVTGQVKSYVMLDSRGPPDRYTGGSSKWAPPVYLLNQKHRVLSAYTANEADELTLNRGEIVVVESVFEDGWAVVHKLDDKNKPEATNSSKRTLGIGAPKLSISASATTATAASPPSSANEAATSAPLSPLSPRAPSWGTRMLRTLLKDDGTAELLGDAATGGKRGVVPYYCLFLMADFHLSMARKPEQSLATIV
ncbi:hypothetical protein HK100_008871 [Physocladia obscura]|uniref:SH3 domain-containing protein n=1 Tax=Physocladia obscura TaxID=109957 RepID=A0AAD5SMW1_9FUNG|nr:hypothetical protein HK100_008871 [Physocladia obscura]